MNFEKGVEQLTSGKKALIVCGKGGVGKTTCASLLAYEAAKQGRKVLILTIDPAKRLKDALGSDKLDGSARSVKSFSASGGELFALMLDVEKVWKDTVSMLSDQENETLKNNKFYQYLSTSFPGFSEFAAALLLYRLIFRENYDLVIVDTAPTESAMDFLRAPRRLGAFLRLPRKFLKEARIGKAAGWSFFKETISAQAGGLARGLMGREVFADFMEFLKVFSSLSVELLDWSEAVGKFLGSPDCGFVTVVNAEDGFPDEIELFRTEAGRIDAVLMNRVSGYYRELEKHPGLASTLFDGGNKKEGASGFFAAEVLKANRYVSRKRALAEARGLMIIEVPEVEEALSGIDFLEALRKAA